MASTSRATLGATARRLVDAAAAAEIVVGILRGEARAVVALRGADDRDLRGRQRQAAAIVHLEEVALEVGAPGRPQLVHDGHIFGAVVVAPPVVLGAGPDAHLGIFAALPAGDDVHAEPAVRDLIDRHRHARGDRRRHRQHRAGGEQLDARRHRGQPGHQRERFEIVVPEPRRPAEAVQLDHRQREVEAEALGLLHDRPVQIEARLVLRRGGGDQPAVVADRNEHTKLHRELQLGRPANSPPPLAGGGGGGGRALTAKPLPQGEGEVFFDFMPPSGRDELVPAPREIAVLVHHRVPHRDVAQAVPERAAVARARRPSPSACRTD